jgi:methyl-accepting chemotaxis protein
MSALKAVTGRINDLSVGKKLAASFTLVVAALLVAVIVGWSSIGSVSGTVKSGYAADVTANKASAAAYNMHVSQIQNVLSGGKQNAMHTTDMATYTKLVGQLKQELTTPAEKAAAQSVDASFAQWQALDAKITSLREAGHTDRARSVVDGAANTASDDLSTKLDSLGSLVEKTANASSASSSSSAQTLMIALAVIAIAVAVALAFVLSRSLATRARQMLKAADGIADGDVHQHVDTNSKDELGQTAAAFERMIEYLNTMADAAKRIAEGDLLVDVQPRSERDELGKSFHEMIAHLREMVGQVADAAGSLGTQSEQMSSTSAETGRATSEIASAVSEVAHGAEHQVQVIEAARRSADEVAAAVQTSAEHAEQTAEVAAHARETAQQGVSAAEQANDAMRSVRDSSEAVSQAIRELATKSEQIGAIVETITGIAEQTNLLALNAAIEAARAGEQGRGFAVVAEEVRKLAEESQHAAQEISGLIGVIQAETTRTVQVVEDGARKTADGADVVEQTREAFVTIGQAVDDMVDRIEEIAAASEEITASATSMKENLNEVAAVAEESSASTEEVSASTQETTASTQQIAASAEELAQNAEQLGQLVAQFKIPTAS